MYRQTIFFLLLFFAVSQLQAQKESLEARLKTANKTKNYKELALFLKNYPLSKKELKILTKKASSLRDRALLQALEFATSVYEQKERLSLSLGPLIHIALFIQTEQSSYVEKGCFFLSSEITGGFPIDYDPVSKKTFILLESIRNNYLGKGGNKVAKKTILYHSTKPKMVVQLKQKCLSIEHEFELVRRVSGMPGILEVEALTHGLQNGHMCWTIYCKLYNQGSLLKMYEHTYPFSLDEKIKIAEGLLTGLASLHKKNIIHRDLLAGNCLIHMEGKKKGAKKITACLTDFGWSQSLEEISRMKPSVSLKYTAPEFLSGASRENLNYYAADLFALGILLYELYYGSLPPWVETRNFTENPLHFEEKYNRLQQIIGESIGQKLKTLKEKQAQGVLTKAQRFELIILSMLSPDFSERATAESNREKLQNLLVHYSIR